MGHAAYNRGTRAIAAQIESELEAGRPKRQARANTQSLLDTIANLQATIATQQDELSKVQDALEVTSVECEEQRRLRAEADKREREKHAAYMDMFRGFEAAKVLRMRQSAVLRCVDKDALDYARQLARTTYPEIWPVEEEATA